MTNSWILLGLYLNIATDRACRVQLLRDSRMCEKANLLCNVDKPLTKNKKGQKILKVNILIRDTYFCYTSIVFTVRRWKIWSIQV